jgi:hypothetical protein
VIGSTRIAATLTFAWMSCAAGALAATTVGDAGSSITIAPYVWLPDLSGSAGLGALSVPIQFGSNALIRGVKSGGMGYLSWQRQNHFAYLDGIFINFGDKNFAPFFGENVDASVKFGEVGGGVERELQLVAGRTVRIAPYAGLRFVEVHVAMTGALLDSAATRHWLDPAAGCIVQLPLNKTWEIVGKFDGAAFGLAGNHYYNALALLDYRAGKNWTIDAGYRYSKADMGDARGLNLDLTGTGPMVGFRYTIFD